MLNSKSNIPHSDCRRLAQTENMRIVEIFRTNIQSVKDADKVIRSLLALYPTCKINFDLEDEENILRVEAIGFGIQTDRIVNYMIELGYNCERIE